MVLAIAIGFVVPAFLLLVAISKIMRRAQQGSRVQFGLRELLAVPIALLPLLSTRPVGDNRGLLLVLFGSFLCYQIAGIVWGWLLTTSNPEARLGWKPALGIVIGGWLAVVVELALAATLEGRRL